MLENEKHEAFALQFVIDLNGKQAAIRAGYSPKTAEVQASKLLRIPKVRARIDELKAKRAERVELKAENVIRELMRLGFSDLAEIFSKEGQLRAFRDIPEETRRAISSIKVKSHREPGDEDIEVWTTEFKLWDKPASLGMLAKHLKLLTDKIEVSADESFAETLRLARERAERLKISGGAGTTANAAAQSKGDSDASLGPDGDES